MSADPCPTSPPVPLPRARAARRRTRRDVEGPGRDELDETARRLAAGMRRDTRTCSRFERRLHVLDLLHRDPQLLAEVVLELAEPLNNQREE